MTFKVILLFLLKCNFVYNVQHSITYCDAQSVYDSYTCLGIF